MRGSGQSYNFAALAADIVQLHEYFYGPAASELGITFSGGIAMDPAGGGEGIAGADVIVAAMK